MGQGHARTGAPAEMNHKHCEKFLKTYQGYLELCESLRENVRRFFGGFSRDAEGR